VIARVKDQQAGYQMRMNAELRSFVGV